VTSDAPDGHGQLVELPVLLDGGALAAYVAMLAITGGSRIAAI